MSPKMVLVCRIDQAALGWKQLHRFILWPDQFTLDLLQMIPVFARLAIVAANAGMDQWRSHLDHHLVDVIVINDPVGGFAHPLFNPKELLLPARGPSAEKFFVMSLRQRKQ